MAKSHKPDPGATAGRGGQGRIGATTSSLLTQHLLKTKGKLSKEKLEIDPRAALLRHEGKSDVFSSFTAAYATTQPKPIFAQEEEEDEDED